MFTETSLRKIKEFSPVHPVVSMILNTEPKRGNSETHRLRLRSMLKELPLKQDVEAIEQFFDHKYDWSGRGVAVFSCAPSNFFEYFPLSVPVRDFIKIASKAQTEPLEDILKDFNDLGVILADQQGARLFHFHLGELVEHQGILGETIKHVKTGSAPIAPDHRGGTYRSARSSNESIEKNTREIIDFAIRFFETHRVKQIILAGSEDNVARLRAGLPKTWQGKVSGSFPMSMTATNTEVLHKIHDISSKG